MLEFVSGAVNEIIYFDTKLLEFVLILGKKFFTMTDNVLSAITLKIWTNFSFPLIAY